MNITILDDYRDVVRTLKCYHKVAGNRITIWNDHSTDINVLADRLKETEALALLRERTPIRSQLLERLSKLRIISHVGAYPHIEIEACTRRGVIVSSYAGSGQPSYATAELAWGLIIASLRRIPQEMSALKSGKWQAYPMGTCLRGKTLGIFGYGRIGRVVAGYGKAFGMNVLIWGRESTLAKAKDDGYPVASSNEVFFKDVDVLSLHMRLDETTRGIVTATDLRRMKPTALLVNTSRSGLIIPGALEAALRAGQPGMAAVDVFDHEPVLGAGHPLLGMDNVVCTPHLGFVEQASIENMFNMIFDQILAYAHGRPINVVNPESLEKSDR
jgi:D-3-phosphoglycerate dehydrogenase / 2-oxoglutarate reductase